MVLLGLRVSPSPVDSLSPSERVFGSPTAIPSSFPDVQEPEQDTYASVLRRAMLGTSAPPVSHARDSPVWIDPKLQECSHVFIRRQGLRRPLEPLYDGPFKILKRANTYYTVQLGDSQDTVSITRLKPVLTDSPIQEARPKKRGRPPKEKRTTSPAKPTFSSSKGRKRGRPFKKSSPSPVVPAGPSQPVNPAPSSGASSAKPPNRPGLRPRPGRVPQSGVSASFESQRRHTKEASSPIEHSLNWTLVRKKKRFQRAPTRPGRPPRHPP